METITNKKCCSFYNGRVTVDELKQFADHRGFVSEFWRSDDSLYNSSSLNGNQGWNGSIQKVIGDPKIDNIPQMCYFSHTEPFIMRGPHYHQNQTDWFITIKSKMLYMFVDESGKSEYFITEPDKIYRIKVEPGVIHSYRNLSLSEIAVTANFPSSLFMGIDKKDDIDEIRYEEVTYGAKNIYILGAGGRLGKAVTKRLLENMGNHKYNVIPVYDKFETADQFESFLEKINRPTIINEKKKEVQYKTENDIIINCIAKTNVQKENDSFEFSNIRLPELLLSFCSEHCFYGVHFSTDYVYQTGEVSEYTKSKKEFESFIEDIYNDPLVDPTYLSNGQKYFKIVRLANLFSQDVSDTHNALNKLWKAYKNGCITIPRELFIMPTDVDVIAEYLCHDYIPNISSVNQFINMSGAEYLIEDIFFDFFKVDDVKYQYIDFPKVVNHPDIFLKRTYYKSLNCDKAITNKCNQIKNGIPG